MVSELRQGQRIASFRTPLGEDVFSLLKFEAEEALSETFCFNIKATSTLEKADVQSIIGEKCSLKIILRDKSERIFNGILTDSQWLGKDDDLYHYEFTLRPWLWLLTQRADCRIFKEKSPINIIKKIFEKEDKADFVDRTTDKLQDLEYCVQYRETDFDFVSRLMEQYGIYYYFKHSSDGHKLVLSDSRTSHDPVLSTAEPAFKGAPGPYPFLPKTNKMPRQIEHITHWSSRRQLRTGKIEVKDYDYKESESDLTGKAENGFPKTKSYQVFDYPGAYLKRPEGDHIAKVWAEAVQAPDERRFCGGEAPGLYAGALMNFSQHPTGSENDEYLVVRTSHAFGVQSYRSSRKADDTIYHGAYELQKSDRRFRAPLVTPKPIVHGPHTAKVVAEKNRGEEGAIDVDEYGCIYVRFHWDRESESTSRRVRVAQVWAGSGWGGQIIPRIGQEVVVSFLEGDPDQPVVIGAVPNNKHELPYKLPADKTHSGLKSQSAHSSAGIDGKYNEIKFEDPEGSEMFSMRAEKDHAVVVQDTETRDIAEKWTGGSHARETTVHNGDDKLHVNNGSLLVDASTKITFTVGQSVITMTPASIEISSPTITITSTIKTDVNSAATVIVKGGIVLIN